MVQADLRGEASAWSGQSYLDLTDRVAIKSTRVGLVSQLQGTVIPVVLYDGIVVGINIQTGFGPLRFLGRSGIQFRE